MISLETNVKFGSVGEIKVAIAQKKVDEQIEFVVKLSCEVPLNIESIARLVNMAHADVPISCTFASSQLMLDLKLDSIQLVEKQKKEREPAMAG